MALSARATGWIILCSGYEHRDHDHRPDELPGSGYLQAIRDPFGRSILGQFDTILASSG